MRMLCALITTLILAPSLLRAQEYGKESIREIVLGDSSVAKQFSDLAKEKNVIEKAKILSRANGISVPYGTKTYEFGDVQFGSELILQRKISKLQSFDPLSFENPTRAAVFSRNKSVDRVLDSENLKQFSKTNFRASVAKEFCKDPEDLDCRLALVTFGASVPNLAAAKAPNCKHLQSTVAALPAIQDGNLDEATSDQLLTVSNYYAECTTPAIPEHMLKLMGVVVDTTSSLKSGEAGILVDGKKWRAIGMAVQLSASQIFTARHVIFNGTAPDGNYAGRRNLENLMFVPVSSPAKGIRFASVTSQLDAVDDSGEIPRDQVLLVLATPFEPGQPWPIVMNYPMAADSVRHRDRERFTRLPR